jgi:hypothetical protein
MLACGMLAGPVEGAAARELSVAPGAGGDCFEGPCDLELAVELVAIDGDRLTLAPGQYNLSTELIVSDDIQIRGRPGDEPPRIVQAAANMAGVEVGDATAQLSDLEIHSTAPSGTHPALGTFNGAVATLDRVEVTQAGATVTVAVGPSTELRLLNSSVQAGPGALSAVVVGPDAHAEVVNSTLVTLNPASGANAPAALSVAALGSGHATATVRNSILDGEEWDLQMLADPPGTVTVSIEHSNYQEVLESQQGVNFNEGPGQQLAAPVFVNRATGDLRQAPSSPTIDAGVPDARSALDFQGEGRPGGVAPDIGADEYHPDGPVRYASPGAIGRGFCSSPLAACSLRWAVEEVAVHNDEVVVMPGTYELAERLDVDQRILLAGQEGFARPLLTGRITGELMRVTAGAGAVIADLQLRNDVNDGTALDSEGNGVNVDRVVAVALGLNAHAISVGGGDTVTNSVARAVGADAVGIFGDGAVGSGNNMTVRNTTGVGTSHGIEVVGPGPEIMVVRNVIAFGPDADLVVGAGARIDIDFSNYNGSVVAGILTEGSNNQTAGPLFVNAAAGDLHQMPGSPTIDAGFNSPGANGPFDFEGDPRRLGEGTDIGADEFRALALVTTGAAFDVGQTGATLAGSVDPQGLPTSVRFAYGLDTGYGSLSVAQDVSGTDSVPFTAAVSGLSPGTTYHYRAVATHAGGTSVGPDMTFTTAPPTDPPGTGPPGTGPPGTGPPGTDAAAARVSAFSASPRRFARGGTTFRYTLTRAAQVRVAIARKTRGRRVGGRCRKQNRRNRTRPACSRFVSVGRPLQHGGRAGQNSLAFSGRLAGRRLRPGTYRATVTVVGNSASRGTLTFRVIRRR